MKNNSWTPSTGAKRDAEFLYAEMVDALPLGVELDPELIQNLRDIGSCMLTAKDAHFAGDSEAAIEDYDLASKILRTVTSEVRLGRYAPGKYLSE